MDVHAEAGCKKAENLFKELMMKIAAVQDSFRAQTSYVLEQTLDFSTACCQFKVGTFEALRFDSNSIRFESAVEPQTTLTVRQKTSTVAPL